MKNSIFKKMIALLIVLTIAFPYMGTMVYASTYSEIDYNVKTIKAYTIEEAINLIEKYSFSEELIMIELDDAIDIEKLISELSMERAGGTLKVFVLGLLAGYVIDGVFIGTTGQSPGDWMGQAVRYYVDGVRGIIDFMRNPTPLPNYRSVNIRS